MGKMRGYISEEKFNCLWLQTLVKDQLIEVIKILKSFAGILFVAFYVSIVNEAATYCVLYTKFI